MARATTGYSLISRTPPPSAPGAPPPSAPDRHRASNVGSQDRSWASTWSHDPEKGWSHHPGEWHPASTEQKKLRRARARTAAETSRKARRRGRWQEAFEALEEASTAGFGEEPEVRKAYEQLRRAAARAVPRKLKSRAVTAFRMLAETHRLRATAYGKRSDSHVAYASDAAMIRFKREIPPICDDVRARTFFDSLLVRHNAEVSIAIDALAQAMENVENARSRDTRILTSQDYNVGLARFRGSYGQPEYYLDRACWRRHRSHITGLRECKVEQISNPTTSKLEWSAFCQ